MLKIMLVSLLILAGCEVRVSSENKDKKDEKPPKAPETLPASRLQEVYNCRLNTGIPTSYGGEKLTATIIVDTKTGEEFVITNTGGLRALKK